MTSRSTSPPPLRSSSLSPSNSSSSSSSASGRSVGGSRRRRNRPNALAALPVDSLSIDLSQSNNNNTNMRSSPRGGGGGGSIMHWKTAVLLWTMSAVCVFRMYQNADLFSLLKVFHQGQDDASSLYSRATHPASYLGVLNGKKPQATAAAASSLQQRHRHLVQSLNNNNVTTVVVNGEGVHVPRTAAVTGSSGPLTAEERARIQKSGQLMNQVLGVIDERQQQQQQQLLAATPPPTGPPVTVASTVSPTAAPTVFSYVRHAQPVVHAIHTTFDLTGTGSLGACPHLLRARFHAWQHVTVPSLVKQTSQDFLYLIWVVLEDEDHTVNSNSTDWLTEFLTDLKETVAETLPQAVIVAASPREAQLYQYHLRAPWFASTAFAENHVLLTGNSGTEVARLVDYHAAAVQRSVLESVVEPGDGLFKDFVKSLQKQAATSLAHNTGQQQPRNFQVWCALEYVEWRPLHKPYWNKQSKRGFLQGHVVAVAGQQDGQPQCPLQSGLTVGYAVGTPKVSYSAATGIAARDAPPLASDTAWTDYLQPWSNKKKKKKAAASGPLPPGHLPVCSDDVLHNCFRPLDVGLFEYGVLVLQSAGIRHDLTRVPMQNNGREQEEQWRAAQDATFGILASRFGVDPKTHLLEHVKPFLKQFRLSLLREQLAVHEAACGGAAALSQFRRQRRRLQKTTAESEASKDEPQDDEASSSWSGYYRILPDSMTSSSVPAACNLASLVVVEDLLSELQGQEQELQQQEAVALQKEKEAKALLAIQKAQAESGNAVPPVDPQPQADESPVEEEQPPEAPEAQAEEGDAAQEEQDNNAPDDVQASDNDQQQQQLLSALSQLNQQPGGVGALPVLPRNTKWENRHNVVHVVHSRFMQHQAQLLHLGQARIDLFRTFTLPSMRHQTNLEYLWMIWTDPDLNPTLLQRLMDEIARQAASNMNIVVIGNANQVNQDFRQSMNGLGGDDDDAESLDNAHILFGSKALLLDYYKASQTRILLETRLDADDALSKSFVETVQAEATETLATSTDKADFRVWCANRYVDWRYYSPTSLLGDDNNGEGGGAYNKQYSGPNKGYLAPEQDLKGCVTVGLTMGFQTEAAMDQLPTKEHHKIREALTSCEKTDQRCVRGLHARDHHFLALRARTPTSTSMVNVVVSEDGSAVELAQKSMWQSIERDFSIGPQQVWSLRDRFQDHLPDILLDAIAGLCKAGHSCRQSSKAMLMKLLKQSVAEGGSNRAAKPYDYDEEQRQRDQPTDPRLLMQLLQDAVTVGDGLSALVNKTSLSASGEDAKEQEVRRLRGRQEQPVVASQEKETSNNQRHKDSAPENPSSEDTVRALMQLLHDSSSGQEEEKAPVTTHSKRQSNEKNDKNQASVPKNFSKDSKPSSTARAAVESEMHSGVKEGHARPKVERNNMDEMMESATARNRTVK